MIERFIVDLGTIVRQRVLNASPVRQLSAHDNKRIELVTDSYGDSFVRRSYGQRAVDEVNWLGIPFTQAYTEMQDIFSSAGIGVVPNILLQLSPQESEYSVVVVTKYLGDSDVSSSSKEAKTQLATGLGAILRSSGDFFPSMVTFMPDMFKVSKGKTGVDVLTLVDLDPNLTPRQVVLRYKDDWYASYIRRISDLIWDKWCRSDEEKTDVMRAFFISFTSIKDHFNLQTDSKIQDALMIVHAMTQGFDFRSTSVN